MASREGDSGESVDRLYRRLAPSVRRTLRSCGVDTGDLDDLCQEVFLRVLTTPSLLPVRSAGALLETVARRVAIDHIRRMQRRRTLQERLEYAERGQWGDRGPFDSVRDTTEMLAGIGRLPRTVVSLRALYAWSFRDIGAIFGRNEGWARVVNHRALARLRRTVSLDASREGVGGEKSGRSTEGPRRV